MVSVVEKKHGFDYRDYHNFHYKVKNKYLTNMDMRDAWFNKHPGCTNEEYKAAPDGECLEIEYMDLWHYILEHAFYNDVHNGGIETINWMSLYEEADDGWAKDALKFFADEYGDKEWTVCISW